MVVRALHLTLHFLRRDLKNRFAGSLSGGLWALIQPLLQLAIYAFVFVKIFKAKVPGAAAPGYVPFLVAALWPWVAFSDAILRSTTAIQDNAALIGKVALPREVLVLAATGASFILHIAGFVAIVVVLALAGQGVSIAHLPLALPLFVPLFALALGIGFVCAAVQVFVRDLAQALGQLLTLVMFASPVFYDRGMLPERYQNWLDLNPFTFYVDAFRSLLLGHGAFSPRGLVAALIVAALVLALGCWVFRRLDPHFEDFL